MDENQIINLLKTASAYDNRRADPASVLAWAESARRGRWTYERALDAIHEHYANHAERIMPGHITAHHRANPLRPSDQSVDAALGLGEAPPASPERRAAFMAQIRKLADRKSIS
ncbi:MAG: hypothetical protein QM658_14220 [Gordonia sp. (in: high G+C Gram-positive bacteria)]